MPPPDIRGMHQRLAPDYLEGPIEPLLPESAASQAFSLTLLLMSGGPESGLRRLVLSEHGDIVWSLHVEEHKERRFE